MDITFQIGSLPLYKGYSEELPAGTFYTEINIAFENWDGFSELLSPSNTNNSLIGCVTDGLPFSREVQCLLRGGSGIENEPTIRITNYDWVVPFSTIRISLANIKQLNITTRNTLYVSVILKRVGSWKEGYLYNPQQLTFKQTSSLSATLFQSVNVGYLGANAVGQPTTF